MNCLAGAVLLLNVIWTAGSVQYTQWHCLTSGPHPRLGCMVRVREYQPPYANCKCNETGKGCDLG